MEKEENRKGKERKGLGNQQKRRRKEQRHEIRVNITAIFLLWFSVADLTSIGKGKTLRPCYI